jgi:PPOX class probable F420-dependent enzyme
MSSPTLDPGKPEHARADERLRKNLIIWLSTVRPDGRPHIVPVWFLWDGETILIFSKPDQKIRNLKNNPNVMLGTDREQSGGDVVLIEGTAELAERGSITPAHPPYEQKYAEQLAQFGWTGESMGREYTEPIRITPTKFLVG